MRAALEVIAERGYRGASLAAVAERVGLTQKYNAMRPAIVQTFSALLGESVTEEHPAWAYFTERYAGVRAGMAGVLRAEYGDRLPSGLTPRAGRTPPRGGPGRPAVPVAAGPGVGRHGVGVPGLPDAAGRGRRLS